MKKTAAWIRAGLRRIGLRIGRSVPPDELFRRFRAVLASNNRSLEIITDIGETLSGDYLFDIQYVRRSYADLSASLERSLASFDLLTQGRYHGLDPVFRSIDSTIRRAMEEQAPATGGLVISAEQISDRDAGAVGGKAMNLAELGNRLRMAVPAAFVITTQAGELFLKHNRVRELTGLSGPDASETDFQEAQELILHGEMPPNLAREIESGLKKLRRRCSKDCYLAVRSSAGEEDGEFSFAGQFGTVLNVPAEIEAVEKAYRKVLASLFDPGAVAYQHRLGYRAQDMQMAVICMVMVDAAVSGIAYSRDPRGDADAIVINSAWGLGSAVVEGTIEPDQFRVKRDSAPGEMEQRIGAKDRLTVRMSGGGTEIRPVPATARARASLSSRQVAEIAGLAKDIERHFRRPQDIEWAIDGEEHLFILQSRALRPDARASGPPGPAIDVEPILHAHGSVVYRGAASGRVVVVRNMGDLDRIPRGAIVVARHDSSQLVRVMADAAAIITDTGALTSHMASLCREFRLPTAVNTGDMTRALVSGQQVTVHIDDAGVTVYPGVVPQLLGAVNGREARMEELAEYRKKRYLLRYIAPLNLVDPLRDEFVPKACRTLHDILRFIHEKSVAQLIDRSDRGWRSHRAVRLDLPIPAGIVLIDIGDGIATSDGGDHVAPEQVTSLPLRAVIAGMTHPNLWRSEAVPLRVQDFLTSMLRTTDIVADSAPQATASVAVISREYANLNLKFGYHFIILDCYIGEAARNNHIYFRFAGGATDLTKRSRRLRFMEAVLKERGFLIRLKGDMLIARLAGVGQEEMGAQLNLLGRLISYTRQLDAVLQDDEMAVRYAENFLAAVPGTTAHR
ncbi:MAG: PEP/pyruvate-binding domain-containing protein [Nitrospirota bacterium]